MKNAAACYYMQNNGLQAIQLYEDLITRNPVVHFDRGVVRNVCALYDELCPLEER